MFDKEDLIDRDVMIDGSVRLKGPFEFGNHIAIDYGVYCTTRLRLGDYVHIGPHCSIIGGKKTSFTMKEFTFLAAGSRVICASDQHSKGEGFAIPWVPEQYRDEVIYGPVTIERFAGVCTGAILFPGVTIAEGSIVGAGCVVRHDTEPWMVYVGNPMRMLKSRPKEKVMQYAKEMGYL